MFHAREFGSNRIGTSPGGDWDRLPWLLDEAAPRKPRRRFTLLVGTVAVVTADAILAYRAGQTSVVHEAKHLVAPDATQIADRILRAETIGWHRRSRPNAPY
jgi:hypothetical protein